MVYVAINSEVVDSKCYMCMYPHWNEKCLLYVPHLGYNYSYMYQSTTRYDPASAFPAFLVFSCV